jgi:hypothetical protein
MLSGVQVHQSRCISHHQYRPSERPLTPSSPDEMQQKFGEDSIWVYEILRYAGVNYDQADNGEALSRGIDRTEGGSQETVSWHPYRT